MGNLIEQQALDFANVPLIQRGIKSSVHLEDWEDVLFWDTMIQRVSPGRYNYISYSKSDGGLPTTGCDQCMKYADYTSKRFFIAVDSDWDYLLQRPGKSVSRFIAQTYTYSWENHYTFAACLQDRFSQAVPSVSFDFNRFLGAYSKIVYYPLLALLHCLRYGDNRITSKMFSALLPHQCNAGELSDNGRGLLLHIENDLSALLSNTGVENSVDFEKEVAHYAALGLVEENAYLHVRGHNVYDLLKSMGRMLCSPFQVDFENDVLNLALPQQEDLWELKHVADDLSWILS